MSIIQHAAVESFITRKKGIERMKIETGSCVSIKFARSQWPPRLAQSAAVCPKIILIHNNRKHEIGK